MYPSAKPPIVSTKQCFKYKTTNLQSRIQHATQDYHMLFVRYEKAWIYIIRTGYCSSVFPQVMHACTVVISTYHTL